MKESKCVDPFQLFTAFDGEPISTLHKLAISQADPQGFEEIFPFGENIDFFIIVCHSLIEDKPFRAMADPLHGLFLTTGLIILFLLVDVAIEVVLMVRLPRLRTHVAKAFPTCTSHIVTAHRSFDCFVTPWTDFSVLGYPLCISLLSQNFLDPTCLFLAVARVMIITLASKTKDLSTCTGDCVQRSVYFDAITAVNSRTKTIVLIICNESFAKFLLELHQARLSLFIF